jgi:hypothetical protein
VDLRDLTRFDEDADQLPLIGSVQDFPEFASGFPGTSIWHFGYKRGGWIKRIAGPEESNPWGRLTRLFFSYPLPFEIRGAFARTDTETGRRTVKGAFYRILDQSTDPDVIEYRSGEKSERPPRSFSPKQCVHRLLLPPRPLLRRSRVVVPEPFSRPNLVQLTKWQTGTTRLRTDLSRTAPGVRSKHQRGIVSSRQHYHVRHVIMKDLLA